MLQSPRVPFSGTVLSYIAGRNLIGAFPYMAVSGKRESLLFKDKEWEHIDSCDLSKVIAWLRT